MKFRVGLLALALTVSSPISWAQNFEEIFSAVERQPPCPAATTTLAGL